jgi:IS5 family transposase
VRADTTVTETNIHWPTDSSLLWDTYRVIDRLINQARKMERGIFPERFHPRKIKKLHLFITRYVKSTDKQRQRLVEQTWRTLIDRVAKALQKAEKFVEIARRSSVEVQAIAEELDRYLPTMRQVVEVARRHQIDGEKVPNDEKVFSIFEPHTELIKRGRRGKPVEFGHKILLSQSREKFITDYVVLEENKNDAKLLEVVIDRHKEKYGHRPKVVAADKGFCPDGDEYEDLEDLVDYLAVPRRTRDFGDAVMSLFQQWRAGIEGTISCLKRVFRLARCCFRGFKNFASAVGSAVFCHNLTVLAKLEDD